MYYTMLVFLTKIFWMNNICSNKESLIFFNLLSQAKLKL